MLLFSASAGVAKHATAKNRFRSFFITSFP